MMRLSADVDIRAFETFVDETASRMQGEAKTTFLRSMALRFLDRVVPITPEDTGRAKGGWTGMPNSQNHTHGASERVHGDARYRESTRAGALGFIEIHNAVPYIVYLELGSSQQAPSGFVRVAMRQMMADDLTQEVQRTIEKELRLANIKARRVVGLRQGLGPRDYGGRANLLRK